ncbi:MAG: molybdopterin-guanine dinucleotide biosynthesis protein B [Candidatus Brocadiae bacterium]|nr:molybdopterin-guanine dinucleotide biosynthesis protein B [Candidatus Brocadiia bacterium]
MKLIGFRGPSNSGKTWMVERLISLWTGAGLRVGVLKHCSKGYQLDRTGKDSSRFWTSGAAVVGVAGPEEYAVRHRVTEPDPVRIVAESFPKDLDVVLVEGFRDMAIPCVRVLGEGESVEELDAPGVIAGVAAHPDTRGNLPIYALQDETGLAEFLSSRLGIGVALPRMQSGPVLRHERAALHWRA